MDREELARARETLRERWRELRFARQARKNELLTREADPAVFRKDKIIKNLRKEQGHYSQMIKHIEQKINRKIARGKSRKD